MPDSYYQLINAIQYGDKASVQALINSGHTLQEMRKFTQVDVFKLSAKNADIDFFKYLISLGACPKRASPTTHETLLQCVVRHEKIDVCQWLINEHQADPNTETIIPGTVLKSGETVLHTAAATGNLKLCRYLVDSGARVHTSNRITGSLLLKAISAHSVELSKFFLENGATSCPNHLGTTELILAVKLNHLEIVKLLFTFPCGTNIHAIDRYKRTALHYAISDADSSKRTEKELYQELLMCDFLISKGSLPSAYDKNNITPLHLAAKAGNLRMCRYLVRKGATLTRTNINRYSLHTNGTGPCVLSSAAQSKNIELCQWLISHGVVSIDNERLMRCYYNSIKIPNNQRVSKFFNVYMQEKRYIRRLKSTNSQYCGHFTQLPAKSIIIDKTSLTVKVANTPDANMHNNSATFVEANLDNFALSYGISTSTLLASPRIRIFLDAHPKYDKAWHQLPKEKCRLSVEKRTLTIEGNVFNLDHFANFYRSTAADLIQYFGPYQSIISSQVAGGELGISTHLSSLITINCARRATIATAALNSKAKQNANNTQILTSMQSTQIKPPPPTLEPKAKKSPKRSFSGRALSFSERDSGNLSPTKKTKY